MKEGAASAASAINGGPIAPRLLEWLWRGGALRKARAEKQALAPSTTRMSSRARIAAEVGAYVLDPSGPWASGNAEHLACGLFAESIGWSLRLASSAEGALPLTDKSPLPDELATLLERCAPLLADAAQTPERLARARRHLLDREFEGSALGPAELARAAQELRDLSERLVLRTDAAQNRVTRLLLQRFARVGGFGLLLSLLILAAGMLHYRSKDGSALSRDQPWTTSSTLNVVCASPLQHCGSDSGYFFHTNEDESPWLEIDLQRTARFSSVHVQNRRDCCPERAIPLIIEVSGDHQTYREVARQNQSFQDWTAKFDTVSARWVRLRVARRSYFHLYDVRILP